MKSQLIAIVAAVLVVGCGQSEHQHSHDDDHSHAEGESGGHDKDSDGKTGEELKAAGPVEGVKAATQAWADAYNSRVLDRILSHYSAEAVFWEPFHQPFATSHLKCATISYLLARRPEC